MPRTKPLGESAKIRARWKEQDEAFSAQVERIRKMAGKTKVEMAEYLGISVPAMDKYTKCPDSMPKWVERRMVLLAEREGIRYDPGLGSGPRKAEAPLPGVVLMIDPETGFLRAVTA